MDRLSALIVAALVGVVLFYKIVLVHWFISAIIVGVATFVFSGQKLAVPATISSLIIFLVLNIIFVDDNKKPEYEVQEQYQRRNYQDEERRAREEQERRERQERERQEQATANVYNEIFTDYYGAISAHRFSDAYSLLSEREKQNQGSLESFANGRQDVADIEVLSFKVTAERENTVNADYRIKTKDKDGNGFIVRTFDGNVTFVKSSGTWKIDALSSRKTDEHRE